MKRLVRDFVCFFLASLAGTTFAAIIFSDSFETPDITGQGPSNTYAPPGWVSPGGGYYGMIDEDSGLFTTPYGSQAVWIFDAVGTPGATGGRNQSLTTTDSVLNEALQAGTTYTVSFNTAVTGSSLGYRVRLLAIDEGGTQTELDQVIGGPISSTDMSQTDSIVFTAPLGHLALGQRVAIQLRKDIGDWRYNILYDNVSLSTDPAPEIVWDGTDNDWNTAHWGVGIMPPAGEWMIVNSGAANARQDLSGTPSQALIVARDAVGGTVNVDDGGHLTITSGVQVNTGGRLNVNNGTLDAGPSMEIVGGSVSVGAAGIANATSKVNVDAAGTLTVSGALNTPTLNTAGTTSIGGGAITTANVTGGSTTVSGGALSALNAEAGTVGISTPTHAITILNGNGATINSSGAALATNVNLASGTINVAADTAVDRLAVTGGQINAGTNNVIVGSEMKLGNTTFSGSGFGAGGTIDKHGAGRLELNGGTVNIFTPGSPENLNQYTYRIITGADSGISSDNTYTHAIDIGNTTSATSLPNYINDVDFQRYFNATMPGSQQAGSGHNGGNQANFNGDIPQSTYPNLYSLFNDFRYNANTNNIVLEGLTPDEFYELRLYNRTWGSTADNRRQQFDVFVGNSTTSQTSWIVNEDNPLDSLNTAAWNDLVNASGGWTAGTAWTLGYVYQADADGKITLRATAQGGGSYHIYGLTNQVVPSGDGSADMTDMDIVVNSTSTLALGTTLPATFGNLDVAVGQTLTLTGAPSYSLASVTPRAGSTIIASTGAETFGDADLLVGGVLSPGGSIGEVDIHGNLTMLATSTYDWELGDPSSDVVHVTGDLTLLDGWTLNLLDLGGHAVPTDQFDLFTYTGELTWAAPQIVTSEEWSLLGVEVMSETGRVYLTGLQAGIIPEPSTFALVAIALLKLSVFSRRRRG